MEYLPGAIGAVLGQYAGAVVGGGIGLLVVMIAGGLLIRPWWGVVLLALAYAGWIVWGNGVPLAYFVFDFAAAITVGFSAWFGLRIFRRVRKSGTPAAA